MSFETGKVNTERLKAGCGVVFIWVTAADKARPPTFKHGRDKQRRILREASQQFAIPALYRTYESHASANWLDPSQVWKGRV